MFRLLIFLSFIIFSTAKLSNIKPMSTHPEEKNPWVLNLDNDALDSLILRSEGKLDEEFEAIFESMIESFERYGQRVKKPATKLAKDQKKTEKEKDDRALKKEVMRIINKFVMSIHLDPCTYLSETDDEDPSLTLYFKGPYTALTVQYKGKVEWNYFLRPPSQLPDWFYEEHTNVTHNGQAMHVEVPKYVEKEFYTALLRILKLFLSLPV